VSGLGIVSRGIFLVVYVKYRYNVVQDTRTDRVKTNRNTITMIPTVAQAETAAERMASSAISVLPYLSSLKEDMETIRKHGKGLPASAQRCEHLQSAELLIIDLERLMTTLKTLQVQEVVLCSSLSATAPEFTFGNLTPNTVNC